MIDFQRVWDGPLGLIAVALGGAVLGIGIGIGLTIIVRKKTARELAQKWFGELQAEHVKLTAELAQARMARDDALDTCRVVTGYAKNVAKRFTELTDRRSA